VDVARTGVISSEKTANGTYRSVVEVYLKNYGDAAATGTSFAINVTPSSAITYAISRTDGWNVSVNGGNAYVSTRQSIAPGETVCVQISVVTSSVVTGCNVIG